MNGLYCVGQMSGAKRWDAATDTAAAGVWWQGAACGEGGEGGASLHSGHCVHGVEMVSV